MWPGTKHSLVIRTYGESKVSTRHSAGVLRTQIHCPQTTFISLASKIPPSYLNKCLAFVMKKTLFKKNWTACPYIGIHWAPSTF